MPPFYLIVFALLFFTGTRLLAPIPASVPVKPFFVENPLLLRALSGPFHTLAADSYWLRSVHVDTDTAATGKDKQASGFFDSAILIQTLDPLFTLNLRYSTTYLASIQKQVDLAHQICREVLWFYPQYSYPYQLMISNELGYHQPYRYELLIDWVKLARTTTLDSPAWLDEVLIMARQHSTQPELIQSDLQWLLATARNPDERQRIQARIAEQDKRKNPSGSEQN